MFKDDYIDAVNSALGTYVGIELTYHEAENMYFPFYASGEEILKYENNSVAYGLKIGDEIIDYCYLDKSEDDDFLDIQEIVFRKIIPIGGIAEVTELGVCLLEGSDVTVTYKAENDAQMGAMGGVSLTATNSAPIQQDQMPILFGNRILFNVTTNDTTCRVVVYAKYKPHSNSFRFISQSSNSSCVSSPYLTSGYRLSKIFFHKISGSFLNNAIVHKKGHNDTGNTHDVASYTGYVNLSTLIRLTPGGNYLSTKYSDMYWVQSSEAFDYEFVLGFKATWL